MAPSQTTSPAPVVTRTSTPGTNTISPDFTDPSFDPADFLNDSLPQLTLTSSQLQLQTSRGGTGAVNLAELSTRVQSVLSQTNAQNIRHSTTLTQLTDEILRSGSRLAYEVEVLRGETINLSDTLTDGLRDEIARFALHSEKANNDEGEEEGAEEGEGGAETEKDGEDKDSYDPDFIVKLRTLNQVRSHLEDVVQTFGDAMEWSLPPSETSLTSSFISVSAPEPESQSLEEKGQEVAKKLRAEIAELLDGHDDANSRLEAATQRVEALHTLAMVWKGTSEEKARNRFVDGLAKMVDDRRRALEVQGKADPSQTSFQQVSSGRGSSGHRRQESEGPGGGIFKNLQRLREEIYLE